MNLQLHKSEIIHRNLKIDITGSKSESNRLLLLQALYPNLKIENLSNSDDSKVMQEALQVDCNEIDVHHAGTAMRFLTAYFSIQQNREVILTGSSRMQERPIAILVDALQQLGVEVVYLKNEGFPPIKIKGKKIFKNKVNLQANVSSQYISALLLIAPKLENGLKLTLEGEITSIPYINMTLTLLQGIGVETSFIGNTIKVKPKATIRDKTFVVESDWSSASYYYSIIAMSKAGTEISLAYYKENSLQGDASLVEIYKKFGVETIFLPQGLLLKKVSETNSQSTISLDLKNSPDIAQTVAVTCLGLGLACELTGLHTLKIKETDRLVALKTEIEKLGGKVQITNSSLSIETCASLKENIEIATYQDHRMAMAFAPLALKIPIIIQDASVVSKSYPTFWDDLNAIGFKIFKR
ncbi:3-phosphoshikimate 1-carboxyvinyltransferase [Oceanihabitans sediminis]|uniref:3-phosphoshikimate 1-carboxyvinyltransferase n=2 Tax=Pseudomonadati TaxID=3379134 RepID=A0A368P7T2_9FLAO|nr:3-phosphoshikimate 1-carboxyvinyltransferase [Oceanihabitans sediminis]MDX1772611.1 3-phosphoshikimate 1-carboxyvinyltransferase [Oceanihabitans sediminis]RBP34278.1 3-phosphoshikimate 1-carboxyvinyltransferase [Oceanihabitans sediminis]RCU57965.1 3-phosphoshikimate 1-carboxyvinyltransferase [Oceanihabitans sediminis]